MPPTRVYLIRHAETTWNAERRLQGTLDAPLSHHGRIRRGNACINLVEVDEGAARVIALNDTVHLEAGS